ncbi:uncharacterized protein LOC136033820 isoform X3 [Artemia franciscana]|uniref:uncharacterized protein LOC136033820 isoform X3 n=1 Tax=Artemia franciscana TaxID=6661 RepID=UPI0032DA8BE8
MWRDDERCGSDKRDEKIIYFYLIDDPTVIAQCNPAGSAPCCSSYGWCGLGTPWCGCDSCIDYRGTTEESKTEITSSPGDESSASAIPTEETTITSTQEPTSGFTTDVPPEPSCNETNTSNGAGHFVQPSSFGARNNALRIFIHELLRRDPDALRIMK